MKTKTHLHTLGLSLLLLFVTPGLYAQIPFQGFHTDNEGIAIWNADGSGPEAQATGHEHPFGWGNARYYGASRDYDNIDASPNAALAHVSHSIMGFPLFVQALADNGFSQSQVKLKADIYSNENDLEGEDWFTFDNKHYYNRYNGYMFIELSGESLIKCYFDYLNIKNVNPEEFWSYQTNFAKPIDNSENSSDEVKAIAAAFIMDMEGAELRLVVDNLQYTEIPFSGNGRVDGAFFDIHSGYLEKGLPEFPFTGLAADHEGVAIWDADGSGPEPEAEGHTFIYDNVPYQMSYYLSSRDYDDIDGDTSAAFSHFTEGAIGFPNTEIQLAYRGFTFDQLKTKCGLTNYGNDIEGMDWGLDGSIYWYNYYSSPVTIEIAGEPILELVVDTSFCFRDMGILFSNWWNYSSYSQVTDISGSATPEAQFVAASFLKDLGNHWLNFSMEGDYAGDMIEENGREGEFHEILAGKMSGIDSNSLIVSIYKPELNQSNLYLKTYPNPVCNFTTIEYELEQATKVEIAAYNQLGQFIELIQEGKQSGLQQVVWNTEGLPVGVYYCVLKTNQGSQTVKVIKIE